MLLRLSETEFWFSLSDSDVMFWLQGVNVGMKADVEIDEIDVCPLQIQGPKSADLMADLVGGEVRELPAYGLLEARVAGCDVVVSQTGFTGEKGYEFYLRDATLHAEKLWNAILEAGKAHDLMVIAPRASPAGSRRVSCPGGQDMDAETLPFQCNLGYQVPRAKEADYIGRARLEEVRALVEAGTPPFKLTLAGLVLGGRPIEDYAPDFWLISGTDGGEPVGYVTSPWYSPELQTNIAMGYVPCAVAALGTRVKVWLPREYATTAGQPDDGTVVEMPFRPSVNPNAREIARMDGRDAAY